LAEERKGTGLKTRHYEEKPPTSEGGRYKFKSAEPKAQISDLLET
jgi:hypothetical protein